MNLLKTATNKIKILTVIAAFTLSAGIITGLAYAQTPDVVFNNGQGVEGIGDESDFLRINNANGGNVAEVCEDGAEVKLWFYVHNTNPTILNGENYDGIGVAKNTVVDIDLDEEYKMNHVVDASVTADNAALSEDGVSINCGSKDIKLEFVSQQLNQDSNAPAGVNYTLEGSILNDAKLGYDNGTDNVVPGCFEYRAYIEVIVKITVKPEVVLTPAVCTALLTTVLSNNQVRVDEVEYDANDATVNSVTIDYGDGTNSAQIPYTHTYDNPGEYTITATIKTTFDGSAQDVTSEENCTKKVTVDEEVPPQYACEDFRLTFNDRKATVSFVPKATNGATFKDANITYIADGNEITPPTTTDVVGDDGRVMDMYTFAENARNADVNATVNFYIEVDGEKQHVSDDCGGEGVLGVTTTPTPVTPPTTIPSTGAGSVAGIMAAVAAAGAFVHRKFTLGRQ